MHLCRVVIRGCSVDDAPAIRSEEFVNAMSGILLPGTLCLCVVCVLFLLVVVDDVLCAGYREFYSCAGA